MYLTYIRYKYVICKINYLSWGRCQKITTVVIVWSIVLRHLQCSETVKQFSSAQSGVMFCADSVHTTRGVAAS